MASRMTEVGFQYAVGALNKKRAELAGQVADLALQLRHRRRDLAKVDDILRILDPGSNPDAIPPKKAIRYLNVFRQGELGRLIIAILRDAQAPMTNLEIADLILARGGYDRGLWTAIRRRCRANLAYLEAQGRVTKIGHGQNAGWEISAKSTD
jgi:hypothetical protein